MKDGTLSTTGTVINKYDPTPGLPNNGISITVQNTAYAYEWWDSAKQTSITVGANSTDVTTPWAPGYSAFTYDVNGHIKTATDRNLTTPRSFSYWTNAEGQVLQRQELIGGKVDPITGAVNLGGASKSRDHRYFYFDGKRVGNVGNDGVEREDYAQQLARSANALENSDSKYRKFTPTNSADFDENYQPINAGYPGPAPGSYTVRLGDTLENIARSLWGDGQLWYLLAEANGLDGQPSAQLTPNTVLQVPNKVTNFHNTSSTFRPYDPGKAMGDTSPTLPDPMPAPRGKDGGCGGLGQIIVIIVAVVATVFTAGVASVGIGSSLGSIMSAGAGVMTGGMAGGVIGGFVAGGMSTGALIGTAAMAGAVGSIASQGAGIALGLQDSFSWKGVALGALGAGVTAGVGSWLGQGGGLGGLLSGNDPLRVAGRLAVGNIASQGLSVATGLQQKFDWRGVAASAAAGYVSASLGQGPLKSMDSFSRSLATGMAGGIVSAAVRGGSLSRALPGIVTDVIGSTIGNELAESLASATPQRAYRNSIGSRIANTDEQALDLSGGFADLAPANPYANSSMKGGVLVAGPITGDMLLSPSAGASDRANGALGLSDEQVSFGRGMVANLQARAIPSLAFAADLASDPEFALQVVTDLNDRKSDSAFYTLLSAPDIFEYKANNAELYAQTVLRKTNASLDLAQRLSDFIDNNGNAGSPVTADSMVLRALTTGDFSDIERASSFANAARGWRNSAVDTLPDSWPGIKSLLRGDEPILASVSSGRDQPAIRLVTELVNAGLVPDNEQAGAEFMRFANRGNFRSVSEFAQNIPGLATVGALMDAPSLKAAYGEVKKVLGELKGIPGADLDNKPARGILEKALTLAFKTADKVGDLFEKAIPTRLRPMFDKLGDKISSNTAVVGAYGELMFGKVLGWSGLYDSASIGSLQNPSGHGIDMFAKRTSGLKTGRWDVFEIKTSGDQSAGSLSNRQENGPNWFSRNVLLKSASLARYWRNTPTDVQTYGRQIQNDMRGQVFKGFLARQSYVYVPDRTNVQVMPWLN